MKSYRVVIIDPFKREVRGDELKVEDENDFLKVVQSLVGVRFLGFSNIPISKKPRVPQLLMMYDDDALLRDWSTGGFFRPAWYPSFMRGVVVLAGADSKGETVSCPVRAEVIAPLVAFVDAKDVVVPAPTFTSFGKDGRPSETRVLSSDADPSGNWTFESNPGRNQK